MKRIFILVFALMLMVPMAAMAHSTLDTATPAKDAAVDASPEKIEMSFDTKIEKLSNFKLFNAAGEQMTTGKAVVEGSTMTGTVDNVLENGAYTVKWTIIGADGHPVEGEYSFSVAAPSPSPSATPEATEVTPSTAPSEQPSASPAPTASPAPEQPAEEDGGNSTLLLTVGGIIAVAAVLVLLLRKRK
ncbi:copper resistance protein CopC [Paenibacillus sp. GCM10027627]|uniref:copper resistance CopC family protein n=1 Tax=unclassified Paenibacillus TaxID=185978 RepID=UPI00362C64F4